MGDMRYGSQGLKTLEGQAKEIIVRRVMADSKVSEAEAIKIVESWSKRRLDADEKWVACDTERKLLLRDPETNNWHPYIEKAKLFDSEKEVEDCLREMTKAGKLESDGDMPWLGYWPFRYCAGSVKAMTDKNYKYSWHRPFCAQTGIKHKLGFDGKKGNNT